MTLIAENRRARYDYHIEERFEAGIVLEGWEVKAIRAGQVQLTDGYVVIRDGELSLIGLRINALRTASTHVKPEADRTKKLLMHKAEIRRLIGKVEQRGFTLVPLNLHYKNGRVKVDIALRIGISNGLWPASGLWKARLMHGWPADTGLDGLELTAATSSCRDSAWPLTDRSGLAGPWYQG
jgi:SsrA-binding protein